MRPLVLLLCCCGEVHSAEPLPAGDHPAAGAAPVLVSRAAAPEPIAAAGGCPLTLPPLDHLGVVIHNHVGDKYVLDSTAKTCDRAFCALQDRICCPMAPEGSDLRVPCENKAMGLASDGVYGPEWSITGGGRVMRHPDNPYLAFAWHPGRVRACAPNQPDICGEVDLPPP